VTLRDRVIAAAHRRRRLPMRERIRRRHHQRQSELGLKAKK